MSQLLRRMMLTAGALLPLVCCFSGCEQKTAELKTPSPLVVSTVTTAAGDEPKWQTFTGRTESSGAVEVRPQVSGVIKEVCFEEGTRVEKGDLLYRIDPAPFEAALRNSEAKMRSAEAQLHQAEREFRRSAELLKTGAGSRKAYDAAHSDLAAARALLAQRRSEVDTARIDLQWTEVKSPAAGETGRTELRAGALAARSSSLLTTITQSDGVRAVFAPSLSDLAGVRITAANRAEVKKTGGSWTSAGIDFVSQSADPKTGTVLMRAGVPAGKGFRPGEYVKVRLMTGIRSNAVRVPAGAVRQEPDGSFTVFVLRDGRAEARTVDLDLWDGPERLVIRGLAAGEELITSGLLKLRPGMPVRRTDDKKH
ncbi:MAG: efflux RND transporter periplasmic adaptor subunit [Sutterella sp.]